MDIVLAILIIAVSIALIVFVLFQTGGRSNKLSQAISGGSPENYTGKNKQRLKDKKYARVTTILAIVFAVLVIVFAIYTNHKYNHPSTGTETDAAVTTSAPAEDNTVEATDAATEVSTEVVTDAVLE